MNRIIEILIVSLFLFSDVIQAQNSNNHVSYLNERSAGYMMEYAGGFGMVSAGIYYKPFKHFEFQSCIGYTPPAYGEIYSVNFLQLYFPFAIKVNNHFNLCPLAIGAFENFNFGKNILLRWDSRYPVEYYWWNSAFRFGPVAQATLHYKNLKHNLHPAFFFQCSTNDLYIASYGNKTTSIKFHEILVYGLGVKIGFSLKPKNK